MECDKITEIPNIQGFHGIFPDKRDPVDPNINYTTRVFCGGEFAIPLPNDGSDMDDTKKYRSLFTCVDAETMEVRWQVLIDGNCDLVATSYDGKLAATNQYNTENGVHYEDMMSAEMRCVPVLQHRPHRSSGQGRQVQDLSATPRCRWSMARKAANADPKTALTCYVPRAEEPARRERQPRRQVLRLLGQALADRHGDRA